MTPELAAVLEGRTTWALIEGDCLDALPSLPDASVDALVTDPPAGIGFMGKEWDDFGKEQKHFSVERSGARLPRYGTYKPSATPDAIAAMAKPRAAFIAFMNDVMAECLRVLKPGGHAIVWAIPRTSHWTATAIEDAGFEIRDVVTHLFGSGFPKSLNLGDGRGTSLKPAAEFWILARKPLVGTVARNVLEHGTGALNIDACRVAWPDGRPPQIGTPGWGGPQKKLTATPTADGRTVERNPPMAAGRWPANLVLSHAPECADGICAPGCPVADLDRQSGDVGQNAPIRGTEPSCAVEAGRVYGERGRVPCGCRDDSGGASRFFATFEPDVSAGFLYTPKAASSERNAGLARGARNTHPTVKSLGLMTWLCRLVTPPGGLVLDPFAGSGSTLVAALRGGFRAIGIEREAQYVAIARSRVEEDAPLFQRCSR